MQRERASGRHRSVDTVGKARRGAAAALAIASAALTAGCTTGTPASGPATAHPVAATSSQAAAGTVPPVFAVSFGPAPAGQGGDRIGLLSSRTGALLRWLTSSSDRTTDQALSVRGGWVYFVRDSIAPEPGPGPRRPAPHGLAPHGPAAPGPAIWRVRVTGGQAQLVQAGASDYAVSPDGRLVAY